MSDRSKHEIVATYTDQASKGLKQLGANLKGIGSIASTAFKWTGVAGTVTSLAGLVTGTFALKKIVDEFADSITDKAGLDMAFRRVEFTAKTLGDQFDGALRNSITNVGGTFVSVASQVDSSGSSMRARLKEVSESLQLLTGIADDQFVEAFGRVYQETKNADTAFRVLPLAADMAAQGVGDIASVTEALTKSSVGINRMLIMLSPSLKELITDGMSFDQVMATLESRFGGAAKAMSTNYLVAVQSLHREWAEFIGSFGEAAQPGFGAGVAAMAEGMNKLAGSELFKGAGTAAGTAMKQIGESIGGLMDRLSKSDEFKKNFDKFLTALGLESGDGKDVFSGLANTVEKLTTDFEHWATGTGFGQLGDDLKSFVDRAEKAIGLDWESFKRAGSDISKVFSTMATAIELAVKALEALAMAYGAVRNVIGPKLDSLINMNAETPAYIPDTSAAYYDPFTASGHAEAPYGNKYYEQPPNTVPPVPGFAQGGYVDTIPAMLSPGEVVLNARQQAALGGMTGVGAADLFRAAGVPGFAGGGFAFDYAAWASAQKAKAVGPVGPPAPEKPGKIDVSLPWYATAFGPSQLPDTTAMQGLVSVYDKNLVANLVSTGDRAGLELLASRLADRISMMHQFRTPGDTLTMATWQSDMQTALRRVKSPLAGRDYTGWKGYASGGVVGGAPRSNGRTIRQQQPIYLTSYMQTVTTDDSSIMEWERKNMRISRTLRASRYQPRKYQGREEGL